MPRSFSFPDKQDRSVNSPIFLVSPEQVLGFYNQENRKSKEVRVTETVKLWYQEEALKRGWSEATFLGSQCLLKVQYAVAA